MDYLIDILIGAASRIVTGELSAHVEPVARWIIGKAVERLPADDRQRFLEEWLAHLDDTPGTLRKLWHAVGCYIGAARLTTVLVAERQRDVAKKIGAMGLLTDALLGLAIKLRQTELAIAAKALTAEQRNDLSERRRIWRQRVVSAIGIIDDILATSPDPHLVSIRKKLADVVAL